MFVSYCQDLAEFYRRPLSMIYPFLSPNDSRSCLILLGLGMVLAAFSNAADRTNSLFVTPNIFAAALTLAVSSALYRVGNWIGFLPAPFGFLLFKTNSLAYTVQPYPP